MTRVRVSLHRALIVAFLALLTATFAAPASADEDTVRNLDVTFAIQEDGSVLARYELDWHFGEKGRHGIDFGIATRESWDADDDQDAVYRVSDVRVSSPSGAPAQFTEREESWGSDGSLNLRIGDPDTTLDTRDATYVIEYRIEGALRTFEQGPELYWDVTSYDYPPIEQYQVRVTAPEGITEAECLTGDDCISRLDGGEAVYVSRTGTSRTITIAARFPEGSVENAEPILEPRIVQSAEVREVHREVTVQSDGSALVEQQMTVDLPAEGWGRRVDLDLMLRAPWSADLDQVLRPVDVTVHDSDGRPVPIELDEWDDEYSDQYGELYLSPEPDVDPDAPSEREELVVRYRIPGAVGVEGEVARLRVPVQDFGSDSRLREATVSWVLPAPPTSTGCQEVHYEGGLRDDCRLGPVSVSGTTITAGLDTVKSWSTRDLTDFTFPAAAIDSSRPLEPSLDAAKRHRQQLGVGGAVGGGGLAVGLAVLAAAALRGRDQRWAETGERTWPVLQGSKVRRSSGDDARPTRAAKRSDVIAVRFTPPSVPPHEAGLLLDRRFRPTHLAALLVSLAVRGVVRLGSTPLMVQRLDSDARTTTVEASVARHGTRKETPLSDSRARKMRTRLEKESDRLLAHSGWFSHQTGMRRRLIPFLVGLAPLALFLILLPVIAPRLREGTMIAGIGLIVGAILAALYLAFTHRGPALTADGRALLDEVEGFRTYIATAEANQLDWEAGQDIFREFLPWAVLFDLTERWTQVCQTLAAEGRIEQIDTSSFLVGSAGTLGSDLSRFSSDLGSASSPPSSSGSSSSGGSGSSSGFSGGSSGGGGGGTSAGSW